MHQYKALIHDRQIIDLTKYRRHTGFLPPHINTLISLSFFYRLSKTVGNRTDGFSMPETIKFVKKLI
jgi:hypothetical protein